jgi:hypothetical protein
MTTPLTDQELQIRDRLAWQACLGDLTPEERATLDAYFEPLSPEDRRRTEGLVLTGNTFPVKDQIKNMGGIWDGDRKAWLMPDADRLAKAKALLTPAASAPIKATRYARSTGRRGWAPCGYPGCSPSYCDECDGGGRYAR